MSFAKHELDKYYDYRARINARRTGNYSYDTPKSLPKVVNLNDIINNNKKALFDIQTVNNETKTITYYKNVYYDKNNDHFYYYYIDDNSTRRYKIIKFKDVFHIEVVGMDTTKQILNIHYNKFSLPSYDYSRIDGRTNIVTYNPIKDKTSRYNF